MACTGADGQLTEGEALRECLKRIEAVAAHMQKVDERLAKIEARDAEAQEKRLAALVDSRVHALLNSSAPIPNAVTPFQPATPRDSEDESPKPPQTEIVAVEDDEEPTKGGPRSKLEKKRRRKQMAAAFPNDTSFEFGDSLWDAALFIGSPYMNYVDSCLVGVLLLVAIFVQIVFLGIVYFVFATAPMFGEDYRDQLETWRINVGHNVKYYDQLTMTSLVQRVCEPDEYVSEVSSGTSTIIGAIEDYIGVNYLFGGPMLVKVAVLLWSLTVVREIMNCWDLIRAVRALPHGETTLELEEGGSVKWASISRCRFVWVWMICVFRIMAGLVLWMLGNIFLCTYTIETGDILLNAVALEIVLTVAEAMYVLVPSRVKKLLKSLDEMPAKPRFFTISRTDIRPLFLFMVLAATIVALELTIIEEVQLRATGASDTLCGGNRGFIYSMDPFYLVYTTASNPHNYSVDDIERFAFREAVNESIYPETIPMHPVDVEGTIVMAPMPMALHFEVNGLGPVEARSAWDMEEAAAGLMEHHGVACEDALHSLTFARRFLVESGENFGDIDGDVSVVFGTCADITHMCVTWPLARAVCPITCGCSAPLGTLFLSHKKYGCPKGCVEKHHGEYRKELAEVECTERPPAELEADSTWQEWARQVGGEIDAVFKSEPQMKPHENSTEMFVTMGCGVIPYWIEAVKIELDMVVDPCVGNWLEEWLETKALAPACPLTCGCNTRTLADEDWFESQCSEKCAAP